MKYLILVPDGAADNIDANGGKTPLEEANMSNINELAKHGEIGMVRTIPNGVPPGSDAANLAVMGYDPVSDLTGRSPLEAVSMGIELKEKDVAFRTNLVTLRGSESDKYEDMTIIDHSSGDISDEEAAVLINYINEKLGSGNLDNNDRVHFYPGVSYRHALIISDGDKTDNNIGDVYSDYTSYNLTPPHDVLDKQIGEYFPSDPKEAYILDFMKKSYDLLKNHEVNLKRKEKGLNPGNSIWIWGEGIRPTFSPIAQKYGIDGSVISAVDLIKGIGICAGLEPIAVKGATGTLSTNFSGKAEAAISEYKKGKDFVYLHVEAPDECSHQGCREEKIEAIEKIDEKVLGPILEYFRNCGDDFKILIVPDHRTPLETRTHSDDPVPFVMYDSRKDCYNENNEFSEKAGMTGNNIDAGKELANLFFEI